MATMVLPGCGKKSKADQESSKAGQEAPKGDHEGEPKHHSVTLSWVASESKLPVVGYNLYRANSPGGSYVKLNSEPLKTTQYIDTTVEAGHSYIYNVTAISSNNVESPPSRLATATIPKP